MTVIQVPKDPRSEIIGQGLGQLAGGFLIKYMMDQQNQAGRAKLQTIFGDQQGQAAPQPGVQQAPDQQGTPGDSAGQPSAAKPEDLSPPKRLSPEQITQAYAVAGKNPALLRVVEGRLKADELAHETYMEKLAAKKDVREEEAGKRAEKREERLERRADETSAHQQFMEKNAELRARLEKLRTDSQLQRAAAERELDPLKKAEAKKKLEKTTLEVAQLQENMRLGEAVQKAPDGAAAIEGLDDATKATVMGVVQGKVKIPSGYARTRPYWQNIMALARKVDPNLDEAKFDVRHKTQQDFSPGGKIGLTLRYGNNAFQHLDALEKAADALENGDSRALNAVNNLIRQHVRGDGELSAYTSAQQIVAAEMRKFFAGASGGSLTELEQWEKNFSAASTPAQIKQGIREASDLMSKQFNTIANQWNTSMDQNLPSTDPRFMAPESKEIYLRMSVPGEQQPRESGSKKEAAKKEGGEPSAGSSVSDLRSKMAAAKESGEPIEVGGRKLKYNKQSKLWEDAAQ